MDDGERAERDGDTRAAIMDATYRALCAHGYADLTMAAIADEFEKSKAAIHYHYDTKEDLLAAFLEYLLDRFLDRLRFDADDPDARLEAIVDALLFGLDEDGGANGDGGYEHAERAAAAGAESDRELHTALLEIRAQAPHRAAFREQLTANHALVEDLLAETIADGIEQGAFRETDPHRTARLLLATMLGGRVYDLTLDDRGVAADVRGALDEVVLNPLRRPDETVGE